MEELKNVIKLKKDNVVRVPIVDYDGTPTGEELVFDIEDVELPFRLSKAKIEHEKNYKEAKEKLDEIEKMDFGEENEEVILSKKEEEGLKVVETFFEKEIKALDNFLGEGGTRKLLNGRQPYFTMFEDIDEVLQPIYPLLEKSYNKSVEKIKNKYSQMAFKNGKLLK